ncbi:MAG: response regulator transcription factor [Caldilineaceae bacterium]|nr:response regulator transcription factor [Caldilineaceae bacterium]
MFAVNASFYNLTVVREGLRGILSGQPDFVVAGETDGGNEGVSLAAQLQPDVVLMDLRMPGLDGVGAIRQIVERKIATHVLVLTTYDSDADIVRAMEAGVTGYLLRDASRQELFRAVRAAAKGESALTPGVASRLLGRMRTPAEEQLTEREVEVLQLVAKSNSNRLVGRRAGR